MTARSSLTEWLHYIECLHSRPIDLTLDRIKKVAINLDLLHFEECIIILVGGTNGKGTTCCLLESILSRSNIRVGLYISPHLISYNERIRVFGKELSNDVHVTAMSTVENARDCVALTYFEFITLSALYIFKQNKLDVIILEVGLGGRLDATNIINPDISVITNVAIDHVDLLGNSRYMIAKEKSGIFRFNKPAVIGDVHNVSMLSKIAEEYGSKWYSRGLHWNYRIYHDRWDWWSYDQINMFSDLPIPIIPLDNAATALGVLCFLPFSISDLTIRYGLQFSSLPGRFQIISYNPLIVLDVGHNSHAADYLIRRLSMMLPKRSILRVVIGMLKNKDIRDTIICLSYRVNVWYCSSLNTSLSADVTRLFNYVLDICGKSDNIKKFFNVIDAWNQAIIDANCDDCILVFGSFHTVRPVIQKLCDNHHKI